MKTSMARSFPVSSDLFLVAQPVPSSKAAKSVMASTAMDVVAVVDVSGSMTGDLPDFRRDLGNMLPRFLQPGDTFTLVYFSGPKQCGVLLDRAEIRAGGEKLIDIANIQSTLGTLETIGLTCFVDPIVLAGQLGTKLAKERPIAKRTLIMGTDGYDNTSPGATASDRRKAIFSALTTTATSFDRVVTMGVGWCCDNAILQDMAAQAGGEFTFARDIGTFSRNFEAAVAKRPTGAKLTVVEIEGDPIESLVFTVAEDSTIGQQVVKGGEVHVPENTGHVWYLSTTMVGKVEEPLADVGKRVASDRMVSRAILDRTVIEAAYASLVLFAQRMRRKVARAIAGAIGDTRLYTMTIGAFGPQRYTDVADAASGAIRGEKRYAEGFAAPAPIDPNAYTVVDALDALYRGDNRIVPDDPRFSYTPITRGQKNAATVVTAAEVKTLAERAGILGPEMEQLVKLLTSITAGEPVARLGEATAAIDKGIGVLGAAVDAVRALKAAKKPAARYTYLPAPQGYPIDGLVTASEEANVSIRVVRPCTVDLTEARAALPESLREKVPSTFPTFRYQQYTVITGRVLNLSTVTAILDAKTWAEYARAGLVSGQHRPGEVVEIRFDALPLINDSMITSIKAKETVEAALALEQIKGALKVWKDVRKQYVPREESSAVATWVQSAGFAGEDAKIVAKWLGEVGIGDGGFSPSRSQAAVKDKRRSWLLDVTIPGLSSLPSVAKVREKLAKIEAWKKAPKNKEPKLTTGEKLIARTLAELDAFCALHNIDLAKLDGPEDETPEARDVRLKTTFTAERAALAAEVDQRVAALDPVRKQMLIDQNRVAMIAICGGEWFSDLAPGEKGVEVTLDGEKIACTIDVADVDIDL